MNIIMIMSGGVGQRVGANIPKQYIKLNDKLVIDYVIESALKSKLADKIVIVMDDSYKTYSQMFRNSKIEFAQNGTDRMRSVKNGLDYINNKYDCDKIIILDAVAPFVKTELIDDYLLKLDDYSAVITSQKITGALGNLNFDPLDREEYYMTQSPEAFRFKELYSCFDVNAISQEIAWQLPRETKKYLNFDFKDNYKLTYEYDIKYMEDRLKYIEENKHS